MTMISRLKAPAREALLGQMHGTLTHHGGLIKVITSSTMIMIDLIPRFQDAGQRGRVHQTEFSIIVTHSNRSA